MKGNDRQGHADKGKNPWSEQGVLGWKPIEEWLKEERPTEKDDNPRPEDRHT
jgi:hypothetical protein